MAQQNLTYTPDYQALIQNDPGFAAVQQTYDKQGVSEAAQRGADTAKALIQFGIVPNFDSLGASLGLSPAEIAMLKEDVDPHTGELAQKNTSAGLSTTARLAEGNRQAILSLRNSLAAHGALGSGDNAYRTNLQDKAYASQSNDALNSLLGSIGGYQSNYNTARQNDTGVLDAGRTTAWQYEASLPQNQGFHLTYDAKHGVYRDGSGNTYTPHQNDDGTWRLTGSNGSAYWFGQDGQLHTGTGQDSGTPTPTPPPRPPGQPPHDGGGGNNPPGTPPPGPPAQGGSLGGWPVGTNPPPIPPAFGGGGAGGFGWPPSPAGPPPSQPSHFPGSGNNPQIPGAFGDGQPPHLGGGFGWPPPQPGSPAWYGQHPGHNPLGGGHVPFDISHGFKPPLPTPAL